VTDPEWTTALVAAFSGADWMAGRARVTQGFSFHFPLQALRHPETMTTDILRQLAL